MDGRLVYGVRCAAALPLCWVLASQQWHGLAQSEKITTFQAGCPCRQRTLFQKGWSLDSGKLETVKNQAIQSAGEH